MASASPLQVRRTARGALAVRTVVVAVIVGAVLWYVLSPVALPVPERTVTATTPVHEPVYVGVFNPPKDFDRELRLSGLQVHVDTGAPVQVVPLLCRGGSLSVTADPAAFCAELVDPDGRTLRAGDSLVVRVLGDQPTLVEVDPVSLSFREGIRWGTRTAGTTAQVRVLGR